MTMNRFIELTLHNGPDYDTTPVMVNALDVSRFHSDRQITKWVVNELTGSKTGTPDHDGCLMCFTGTEESIRVRESYNEIKEYFESLSSS